jgi:hypothetical protein
MDSTAERLTSALDAAAETVSPDQVRPLREAQPGRLAGRRSGMRTRSGKARWSARLAPGAARLAPVGAAVAVLLVVALAVVATSGKQPARPAAAGTSAARNPPTGAPAYFAEVEGKFYGWYGTDAVQIVVRATGTGAPVARLPNPAIAGISNVLPLSVAAADGDRTFYALYTDWGRSQSDFWIYRFQITPSGHVSGLAQVNGGLITGQDNIDGFAVSPDGSQLALAVAGFHADTSGNTVMAAEIVVINLRTGAHAIWRGGMNRPKLVFGIHDLSWTGDGRSLVYLGQWCPADGLLYDIYGGFSCSAQGNSQQGVVREVHVTSAGGDLAAGPVLLRPSGSVPVVADPDGHDLITVVRSPDRRSFDVVKVSIATGRTTSVLGTVPGDLGPSGGAYLAADPTGNYVLVWTADSTTISSPQHGWVHAGSYHQYAPIFRGPYPGNWILMTW